MNILQALKVRLCRFGEDTRGAMPVEGVIASTFLIWWYFSSLQFFDAYKQKNVNQKAAYTVADMLSRETGSIPDDPTSSVIDMDYMNGLNVVFDYLTASNKPTWLRVTSIYWDGTDNRYEVAWSITTGSGHAALNDAKLAEVADRIPEMPVGDTVILMETFMAYEPMFNFGTFDDRFVNFSVDARWDATFITTRPRFASCIPWEDQGCGDDGTGASGGLGDDVPIIEPDDPPES
jgi:hypothetical protein